MEKFILSYSENTLGRKLISLYGKAIGRQDLDTIQKGEYFDMKISEQDIMEATIEARKKGLEEGRAEGILTTLISLVKDGILTLADAAKRADMSVAEFESCADLQAQ